MLENESVAQIDHCQKRSRHGQQAEEEWIRREQSRKWKFQ